MNRERRFSAGDPALPALPSPVSRSRLTATLRPSLVSNAA
jgi:hypothetical protein